MTSTRVIWLILIGLVLYMGARHFIYAQNRLRFKMETISTLPTGAGYYRASGERVRLVTMVRKVVPGSWLRRDGWMTIPRLAVFILGLFLAMKRWGISRLLGRTTTIASFWWIIGFVGYLLLLASDGSGLSLTHSQILTGMLLTIPVALCEEMAFRVVLCRALSEKMGARSAVLLSSVLFMVWHLGAQSIWGWPRIFLFGLLTGSLFLSGMGWLGIVVLHLLVDCFYFLCKDTTFLGPGWGWLGFALLGTAALASVWSCEKVLVDDVAT